MSKNKGEDLRTQQGYMPIIENLKKQIGQLVNPETEVTKNIDPKSILRRPPPSQNQKFGLNNTTPDLQSFEGTYKTAYSHGLEAIYTIQNVDLGSIRRISAPHSTPDPKPQVKAITFESPLESQLEFDFGEQYRDWIESFVLAEPLHVLGLSRYAEKCLNEHGKKFLKDLVGADLREFIFYKGMGQGHIDEIRQKLQKYLEGRSLYRCRTIDFAAWIRSLVSGIDRKKACVLIGTYGLSELISLSPAENVELRKLTLEKRQELIEETLQQLKMSAVHENAFRDMRQIFYVFFKPWIVSRHGLVDGNQLNERFERVSDMPQMTQNAINFLSSVFFNGAFPLKKILYMPEDNIYCADLAAYESFRAVIEKGLSYFYKPDAMYPLEQLIRFLERDFAMNWQGFPQGFIERTLRLSSKFSVRKGTRGFLEVRLA